MYDRPVPDVTRQQTASPDRSAPAERRPAPAPPRPAPGTAPEQTLALQRTAGNRATTRALARWSAHPDKANKGVFVPDDVAAEYLRFNPPKNQ